MVATAFPDAGQSPVQPLDASSHQIRLLKFHQDTSGTIHCRTSISDLRTEPDFTALSYTWGSCAPTEEIVVIDHKKNTEMKIRQNLVEFLQAYGMEMCEHIWIDQISINKGDDAERNHQVGMMGHIYSQAQFVIVWLGSNNKYTRAVRAIHASSTLLEDEALMVNVSERDIHEASEAIDTILSASYFKRLWTVQETALAKDVLIYARHRSPLPLLTVYKVLKTLGTRPESSLFKFGFHSRVEPRLKRRSDLPSRFTDCIMLFNHMDCGDPRDKVYGLMSLVDEHERIQPDYMKMPSEVFLAAVHKIVLSWSEADIRSEAWRRHFAASIEYCLNEFCDNMRLPGIEPWEIRMFTGKLCQNLQKDIPIDRMGVNIKKTKHRGEKGWWTESWWFVADGIECSRKVGRRWRSDK